MSTSSARGRETDLSAAFLVRTCLLSGARGSSGRSRPSFLSFADRIENHGDSSFSERELLLAEESARARQSASSLAAIEAAASPEGSCLVVA